MRATLLAAACLVVAGCGDEERPAQAPARPAAVRVDMRHNRFVPHTIVARAGQTVRWTNRDHVAHTVASQRLDLSSEGIEGGESFGYRPDRPGRFAYYCTIHAGQTGVLVVR
jgi:plastocyanin